VLKQSAHFDGLGFVEGKKIPFEEVVKMYNEGISEAEIKAWVWYKRKQVYQWPPGQKIFSVTDNDLPKLVNEGAMFIVVTNFCRYRFTLMVTFMSAKHSFYKIKSPSLRIMDKPFMITI